MSHFATELPRLLNLLYDTALDAAEWPTFLNELPAVFGGARGIMHVHGPGGQEFLTFGHDPRFLDTYASHYWRVNPYPASGLHRLRLGVVSDATNLLDAATAQKTEFYNDWMRPQSISPDHLGVAIRNTGEEVVVLCVAPDFDRHEDARVQYRTELGLLTPHLMRAVALNSAHTNAMRAQQRYDCMLEAFGFAAFVLDPAGRVLHANGSAESLLREKDRPVCTRHDGRIKALRASDDRNLQAHIAGAFVPAGPRVLSPLQLLSVETGRAFVGWLVPMERPDAGRYKRAKFVRAFVQDRSLLFMLMPRREQAQIAPEAIRPAFGLSLAEARLVSALVAGRTLEEYAVSTGNSRHTVRNQLAQVFAKTRTNRQAELVIKVISTLGPFFA